MTTEINTMIQELDRIDALCHKKDELQIALGLADGEKDNRDIKALNNKNKKARAFQTQRSAKLPQLNHGINLEGDNAPTAVKPWREPLVLFDKKANAWIPKKHYSNDLIRDFVVSWLFVAFLIGLIVSAVLLATTSAYSAYIMFCIFGFGFIASGIACLLLYSSIEFNDEWVEGIKRRHVGKEQYDEKVKEWEDATKNYISEFCKNDHANVIDTLIASVEKYDKDFLGMVADCETTLEALDDEYRHQLQESYYTYEADIAAIKADIAENEKELSAITLIHPDLFRKAAKISAVLKMYRAESLPGAINIVFDDERREAEEAERRAEAERRERLLEQQIRENRFAAEEAAREMRQHNEAMEKQAQEAQRKADLQRERDNQAAENLLKQRKKAASDRCYHCANSSCSLRVRSSFYNTGDVCPNYRPK
ncbi:MAG: hypothetical protein IKA44_04300 [Clostridia bacterium]|nr:hypothetical protein [Clostridia bacterium]